MDDRFRLDRQVEFLAEIDALEAVERMTRLIGGARRERILERLAPIRDGAPALGPVVLPTLEEVGLGEGSGSPGSGG